MVTAAPRSAFGTDSICCNPVARETRAGLDWLRRKNAPHAHGFPLTPVD